VTLATVQRRNVKKIALLLNVLVHLETLQIHSK
jgi:hypothetical protein